MAQSQILCCTQIPDTGWQLMQVVVHKGLIYYKPSTRIQTKQKKPTNRGRSISLFSLLAEWNTGKRFVPLTRTLLPYLPHITRSLFFFRNSGII